MDNSSNSDFQTNDANVSPSSSPQLPDGEAGAAAGQNNSGQAGAVTSSHDSPPGSASPPPFRPDGLDAGFVGANDKETIERLSTALKDLQTQTALNEAPKDLAAYADFSKAELPDAIKGHMAGLRDDPLFKTAAMAAQKHGVSQAAMQEIVTSVYEGAAQSGLLEPPVDVEAERLALLPEGYGNQPKHVQDGAINARLQANVDYLGLLVKNGKVDNETAEHVAGMLMDTAKGNKFLEFVRMQTSGGTLAQPFGQAGAGGGVNSEGALRDELARVQAKKGTVEYDPTEHEAIMARYRSLYGD